VKTSKTPGATARPSRLWRFVAIGVAVLMATYGVAYAVGLRRAPVMQAAAEAARAAVADARTADAMTWAPDRLLTAEAALRDGLAAQRVEEMRLWPIPDTQRVVEAFSVAERAARDALGVARESRSSAATAAASLIADAEAAVAASEALATTIHLGAARRALLAQARAALAESRVYEREGDFGNATVRARQAVALSAQMHDHAAAVAARYADGETLARWQRWKDETVAWSRREGRAAILVSKEAHTLTLYDRGKAVKTYRIDLGFNWIADKAHAGDGATPEGRYRVVTRKSRGATIYYKALLLDYPNQQDRADYARARRDGTLPASAGIGGLIEIHGEGGRGRDWTKGCVALTNPDIDDLFTRVGVGTPVTIVGNDSYGAIAEFARQRRTGGALDGRQP
jgi:lipoprotein-anchoring transpeptidase ErfK/SrfK